MAPLADSAVTGRPLFAYTHTGADHRLGISVKRRDAAAVLRARYVPLARDGVAAPNVVSLPPAPAPGYHRLRILRGAEPIGETLLVVEYTNELPWYDVNPILVEQVESFEGE